MTFSDAVTKIESALMDIGMRDRFGSAYLPAELTAKLDLHFDDAWSNLLAAEMSGEITTEEFYQRGMILADRFSRKIAKRQFLGTLIRLDQERLA